MTGHATASRCVTSRWAATSTHAPVYQRATRQRAKIPGMLTMRPGSEEYGAFYAGYVGRVPDGALRARLEAQPAEYRDVLAGIDDDRAALPTAPGKWSLLDIVGHVADAERVFAFRLLWFARTAGTELPGFDQDAWVAQLSTQPRRLADLLADFEAVRHSTLTLLQTVPDEVAQRRGIANGTTLSVRALAWIIAGHAQHHLELLRELR